MFRRMGRAMGLIVLLLLLPATIIAAPVGKISSIEGEADVTRADGKAVVVKLADSVSVGDILRTKARGKVEVTFSDGNVIWIAEKSRLKITVYEHKEGNRNVFDLFRGKARAIVNNMAKRSSLELQTPTAICGVRGTIFIGYFTNGVSGFVFEQGQGYGYNRTIPSMVVTIQAGQAMQVTAPGKPPVVSPATAAEINQHLQDTSSSQKKDSETTTGTTTATTAATTAATTTETTVQAPPPPPPPPPPPAPAALFQTSIMTSAPTTVPTTIASTSSTTTTVQPTTIASTSSTTTTIQPTTVVTTSTTSSTSTTVQTTIPTTSSTTTVLTSVPTTIPTTTTTVQPTTIVTSSTSSSTTSAETTSSTTTSTTSSASTTTTVPPTGTISGLTAPSITITNNAGTLTLTGTLTDPTGPSVGLMSNRAMSDGSTYSAYVAGLPGSWTGMVGGIFRTANNEIGLMDGMLDGRISADALSASGTVQRNPILGLVAQGASLESITSLPIFQFKTIDGHLYTYTQEPGGTIQGYTLIGGGKVGIWGVANYGTYKNTGHATLSGAGWGRYVWGSEMETGSALTLTDDGAGHTDLTGQFNYMDTRYRGTFSLHYLGTYDSTLQDPSTGPYRIAGTGSYQLDKLAFTGHLGSATTDYLYANNNGSFANAGRLSALFGTLKLPWENSEIAIPAYYGGAISHNSAYSNYAGNLLWNAPFIGYDAGKNSFDDAYYGDGGYLYGFSDGIVEGASGDKTGMMASLYLTTGRGQAGYLTVPVTSAGSWIWGQGNVTKTVPEAQFGELGDTDIIAVASGGLSGKMSGVMGSSQGTFTGNLMSDSSLGYFAKTDGTARLPWGIYNIKTGGTYLNRPSGAPSWTASFGGAGEFDIDGGSGYWIGNVGNGTWLTTGEMQGNLSGTYLTPYQRGSFGGLFYGITGLGESGNWIGQSVGAYEGENLTIGGTVEDGLLYYDKNGNSLVYANSIYNDTTFNVHGLLGSTGDLWGAGSAQVYMMGTYRTASGTEPYLAYGSGWHLESYPATVSGGISGAFKGYNAGMWNNGEIATKAAAIYISPDNVGTPENPRYNAGWLNGAFAGSYNAGLGAETGMWQMDGTLAKTFVETTQILPADLSTSLQTGMFDTWDMSLSGNLGGAALTSQYYIQGDMLGLPGHTWGIWNGGLGGTYGTSGSPSGGITAKIGGGITYNGRDGYMIADLSPGTSSDATFTGTIAGRFITDEIIGNPALSPGTGISGDLFGSYDAEYRTWQAAGVGTWSGRELKFASGVSSAGSGAGGYLDALAGEASSLFWDGPDAIPGDGTVDFPVTMMGSFYGGNGVWPAAFSSYNSRNSTNTTYDGSPGAYRGFSSVVMDGGQSVDGGMIALYLAPSGETGYLRGSLTTGTAYPGLEFFEADGSLIRLAVGTAPEGVTPVSFYDSVTQTGPLSLAFTAGSSDPAGLIVSETRSEARIAGTPGWGIWQSVLTGNATGDSIGASAASWTTTLGSGDGETARYWTSYSGMTWTEGTNQLAGKTVGAKADWVAATTAVTGGEIKGLFDPTVATWKAIAQGAWMEASAFMAKMNGINMMETEDERLAARNAFTKATNIPAFEVGVTDLRGYMGRAGGSIDMKYTTSAHDTIDVNKGILNATFFAPTAGAKPQIWASGPVTRNSVVFDGVNGNFTGTPVKGDSVPLMGYVPGTTTTNGISANFVVQTWDTAVGSKWGATITGGNVQPGTAGFHADGTKFRGAAAGTVKTATDFKFVGTAAGIAHGAGSLP